MKINRNNYELFFIDYFDGSLDEQQVDQLLHFLKDNPDLEEEFYSFENINTFNGNRDTFNQHSTLLKSINDIPHITTKNFDEFCIAYIENDLNEQNKAKFEMFIAENTHYQQEFEKYKNTKLTVETIPYPNKNKLKKYTGRVLLLRRTIRIAAAASIISATILFFRYDQNQQIMVAEDPTQVEYVAYDDTPTLIADSEDNKTPETNEKKENNKKTQQKTNPQIIKSTDDNNNKTNQPKENKTRPKEQLRPVQKKGVFIVQNDWQKPLVPAVPVNNYDPQEELETLMAEAPDFNNSELTIDKVKALLNDNKKVSEISVWELADMGLRQFGKLTESEYSVKPVISESGKIESVAFTTEKYTLFAPLRRNK